MKKLLSLMLVVCMMLTSVSAFAAVQNEQPPKFVAATVNGAQIDAAGVTLTDVSARTGNDRLTQAFVNVQNAVRNNEALKAAGLNVYDLVIVELFDVNFEGADLELVLELEDGQAMPVAVMFSADGINWNTNDFAVVSDKQFSLKLASAGVVALLGNARKTMNVGSAASSAPKQAAVAASEQQYQSGAANNFMPSVQGKASPQLVPQAGAVGVITATPGADPVDVPNDNYVQVNAPSNVGSTPDIMTYEKINGAMEALSGANDLGDLLSATGTLADDMDAALAGTGLTHDDLVVKNLFDVSAYGEYAELMGGEGAAMEMTLQADLEAGQDIVVIFSADGETWEVLPADAVTVNADGTITLKVTALGTVAVLVEKPQTQNDGPVVTAP